MGQVQRRENSRTCIFQPPLCSIRASANGCNYPPRHVLSNPSWAAQGRRQEPSWGHGLGLTSARDSPAPGTHQCRGLTSARDSPAPGTHQCRGFTSARDSLTSARDSPVPETHRCQSPLLAAAAAGHEVTVSHAGGRTGCQRGGT